MTFSPLRPYTYQPSVPRVSPMDQPASVDVRVNNVAQSEVTFAEQGLERLGVDGGIDDRRFAGLARGDHVRRTPAAFIQDLLEVHTGPPEYLGYSRSMHV
jgi:hypothetical protein